MSLSLVETNETAVVDFAQNKTRIIHLCDSLINNVSGVTVTPKDVDDFFTLYPEFYRFRKEMRNHMDDVDIMLFVYQSLI